MAYPWPSTWSVLAGTGKSRTLPSYSGRSRLGLDQALAGHMDACLDIMALLCVCLEQASLDSGSMDVGYLLSLQEEPPTRSLLAVGGRARAFAPLAGSRPP